MSTFRISKLESYLTVLLRRKDILKQQLSDEALDVIAKQYVSGRLSEIDMIIIELAGEFGIENPAVNERQPEKKGATIERLKGDGHPQIADRLRDWRNSKGTHFGWDSWFVSEYGEDFAKTYDIHTILVSRK
jgi:hypothetical protein